MAGALRGQFGRWNGEGKSLLDPELNIMLTAWQISHIKRRLSDIDEKDFENVSAAYHQGLNAVIHRLKKHEKTTSCRKTPHGHSYVKRAMTALEFFENSPTIVSAN